MSAANSIVGVAPRRRCAPAPPATEYEFQDWSDTEHFLERADCGGFLTVGRFVCIDGGLRYLALYDHRWPRSDCIGGRGWAIACFRHGRQPRCRHRRERRPAGAVFEADTDVLRGPAYARIVGERYSPSTHRIVSRVCGQYRADAPEVHPDTAVFGDAGAAARVALWRFRSACSPHLATRRATTPQWYAIRVSQIFMSIK